MNINYTWRKADRSEVIENLLDEKLDKLEITKQNKQNIFHS